MGTVEILFFIGFIGALVTLPFQDLLDLGVYNISDFFFGLVATACVSILLGNSDSVTNSELVFYFSVTAIILILIKIFVFIPFRKNSENSTTFSLKSLEGKEGEVMTTITQESMGEVLAFAGFTRINKSARIYDNGKDDTTEIKIGSKVLIIEVKENVLYVLPYDNAIKIHKELGTTWNEK